jgi:hypothetical protein
MLPDKEFRQLFERYLPAAWRTTPEMLLEFCGCFMTQRPIDCFAGLPPDTLTIHSTTSENVQQQNLRFPPFQH